MSGPTLDDLIYGHSFFEKRPDGSLVTIHPSDVTIVKDDDGEVVAYLVRSDGPDTRGS